MEGSGSIPIPFSVTLRVTLPFFFFTPHFFFVETSSSLSLTLSHFVSSRDSPNARKDDVRVTHTRTYTYVHTRTNIMTSLDFGEAKSFLMKADSESGESAYAHLQELVLRLITERPKNSLALFEQLSREIKQRRAKVPRKDGDTAHVGDDAVSHEAVAAMRKFNESCAEFLQPSEDGEGAPVQDLMSDLEALAHAGVNLGATEGYRIYLSMKALAVKLSENGELQSLRFWGKVLGTKADYYVCQGQYRSNEDEESEDSDDVEVGDNSPNKFTYWVCNSLADEWTTLSRVRASHVVAARRIRRFFTGDLTEPVKGHPPFPGTEKEYLRAQIAQITAQCSISPKGFFVDDGEGAMVANEEFEPSSESADASTEAWQQHHLDIDASGRCVPLPEEDEDGSTKEAEVPELIKDLEEAAWSSSVSVSKKACLRSRTWQGAYTVGSGRHFASIYIGYGLETSSSSYTPAPPADPQVEFDASDIKEADDVLDDPSPPEEEEGDQDEKTGDGE